MVLPGACIGKTSLVTESIEPNKWQNVRPVDSRLAVAVAFQLAHRQACYQFACANNDQNRCTHRQVKEHGSRQGTRKSTRVDGASPEGDAHDNLRYARDNVTVMGQADKHCTI